MPPPNDGTAGLMRLAPDDGGQSNTGTNTKVPSGSSGDNDLRVDLCVIGGGSGGGPCGGPAVGVRGSSKSQDGRDCANRLSAVKPDRRRTAAKHAIRARSVRPGKSVDDYGAVHGH